ncbi:MAG: hypothetical protein AAGN66_19170 [Acidobacteriota bacterium]
MTESHDPPQGVRLSKDERKSLLAELERSSSRTEPPEQVLQRAQQALANRNLDQAKRLVDQLESSQSTLPGLDFLKDQLGSALRDQKHRENLRTTEEMLTRYIQQRKKPLAQLALETLSDIAPTHPRLAEYRIWVADLDQEVALQQRLETLLSDGREALSSGDVEEARRKLEALQKLDPDAAAVEALSEELEAKAAGEAARADIGRLKQEIESLLDQRDVVGARRALDQLSELDIPKITLDFYAKRLTDAAQKLRDEMEAKELESHFDQALQTKNWQGAREIARRFGERFPASAHASEMYNQVNRIEAGERRQHSIAHGIATLEQFIAGRQKHEAQLALKLLRGMDVDPDELARLESLVNAL